MGKVKPTGGGDAQRCLNRAQFVTFDKGRVGNVSRVDGVPALHKPDNVFCLVGFSLVKDIRSTPIPKARGPVIVW